MRWWDLYTRRRRNNAFCFLICVSFFFFLNIFFFLLIEMMRGAAVRFGNRFFSAGLCVCGARAALNWFQNVNRWSESTRAPSPQVALYLFFSWTPASHFTQISCLEGRPAGRPERKKKRDEVVHDLRDETFTLCFFYFSNLLFFKLKAPNLL